MSTFKAAQPSSQLESRRLRTNDVISFRLNKEEKSRKAYLLNLSMTGMFIRCEAPPPSGTVVSFELTPATGGTPIAGQAQVVWARSREAGHDRPQGMGVTIVRMTPDGRQQLSGLVGQGLEQSGELPETEQLRSIVDDALGDGTDSGITAGGRRPPGGAAGPASPTAGTYYNASNRARRHGFDILAVAALLLLIGVGGSLYYLRGAKGGAAVDPETVEASARPPREADSAANVPSASGVVSAVEAAGAADPETAPPADSSESSDAIGVDSEEPLVATSAQGGEAAPSLSVAASDSTEAAAFDAATTADPSLAGESVREWAAAWSAQDVDAYLGSYAKGFDPPRQMGRRQWEASRRGKIFRPEFIRVGVSQMSLDTLAEDGVRVTFVQDYSSDRWGDTVRKALDMTWEEGRWKILEEEVLATIK